MRLKSLILDNFRAYRQLTRIDFDELTAFIGKNDVGKSSILDALEIFFNNAVVKIEPLDVSSRSTSNVVRIGCTFSELPEKLVLDATATTNLAEEFLLNEDGLLEIHKVFTCGASKPKEEIFVVANHPVVDGSSPLLLSKNADLKKMIKQLGIDESTVDLRANCSIRKAIWRELGDCDSERTEIPLNKEDGKLVWNVLKKELPVFALFQSDRPCTDDDAQVQDPMKLAVTQALKSVTKELEEITEKVQQEAKEVAQRTVEKLREMDEDLATDLQPDFKKSPSWNSLFSLTLRDGDDIPINKRGSGVRRLVLLAFFRAEAERKQDAAGSSGTIYAIEEPETSQHPDYQQLIVKTLQGLAEQDNKQVIITTHVPSLAGLLPLQSLRYVETVSGDIPSIQTGTEDVFRTIADSLGVLPDPSDKVKVLVCVEGPHDVEFLKNMANVVRAHDLSLVDVSSEPAIAFVLLGGSTLKQWVECDYLKRLGIPQFHLYDRDTESPPKYQTYADDVNARPDSSSARLTGKREMENYLHPDAIQEVFGVSVSFGDTDDVVEVVALAVGTTGTRSKKKIKARLNREATKKMTYARVCSSDPDGHIIGWYREIESYL